VKSYYHTGEGLAAFLRETEKTKEIIEKNLALEYGRHSCANMRCYLRLIEHVREHAERLFEYEPTMLFCIQLVWSKTAQKTLFIKVKSLTKKITTVLTIYFSPSVTKTEIHCEESLKWSNDAFHYLFGNSPQAPR
jgi:hypothetical protein